MVEPRRRRQEDGGALTASRHPLEERRGKGGKEEGKGALADAVDTLRPTGEAGDDAVGRWRRGIGRWRWMCDGREWRWWNERGEGNGRRVKVNISARILKRIGRSKI